MGAYKGSRLDEFPFRQGSLQGVSRIMKVLLWTGSTGVGIKRGPPQSGPPTGHPFGLHLDLI